MKSGFQFKSFYIAHDKCAMKVGTDAVLLGCMTPIENQRRILDIGTGSGIIALMLAQRNSNAEVDAIEIDTDAALQAKENFINSPFAKRIRLFTCCIKTFTQQFLAQHKNSTTPTESSQEIPLVEELNEIDAPYDLIVSNPPFFEANADSEINPRLIARSITDITHLELVSLAHKLLKISGSLYLILPVQEGNRLLNELFQEVIIEKEEESLRANVNPVSAKWTLSELILIKPNINKKANRMVIGLLKNGELINGDLSLSEENAYQITVSQFIVRNKEGGYTDEMKQLTTHFMLKH